MIIQKLYVDNTCRVRWSGNLTHRLICINTSMYFYVGTWLPPLLCWMGPLFSSKNMNANMLLIDIGSHHNWHLVIVVVNEIYCYFQHFVSVVSLAPLISCEQTFDSGAVICIFRRVCHLFHARMYWWLVHWDNQIIIIINLISDIVVKIINILIEHVIYPCWMCFSKIIVTYNRG